MQRDRVSNREKRDIEKREIERQIEQSDREERESRFVKSEFSDDLQRLSGYSIYSMHFSVCQTTVMDEQKLSD